MFPIYGKDTRSDNERYLEGELEESRAKIDAMYRRQEDEREQRRRASDEESEWNYRHPNTWPQAFQNQAVLCRREHNQFPDGDPYFKNTADANEKALEIWKRISASKQTHLDELQKQIDAVWESVRLEVANELERSSDLNEYKQVANVIRDDQLNGYCDW
jgi:hypothetical protein